MLLANQFPPDVRVENEAAYLIGAGHEVHLLCRVDAFDGSDGMGPLRELRIHTVRERADLVGWRRHFPNVSLLWFHDARWANEIRTLHRNVGPFDAIHVHDLPLVRTALAVGKKSGAHVVADMHENYPMALPFYTAGRTLSLLGRFLLNPRRWERYERRKLPACSAVIAVADEMQSRLVALGVRRERLTVVENFVDIQRFLSRPVVGAPRDELRASFVIGYVGGLAGSHDLPTAIEAMRDVVRAIPDALLLLAGEGRARTRLEALTADLGLSDHVRFEGWIDFERLPTFLAASDACILPLRKSVQTDSGLANKLFLYMLAGKPVVASDCVGTRRVIEDADCGLLVPPGDSRRLAEALVGLTDPETRAQLGENGRRAVHDRYNWSLSAAKLLSLYAGLHRGRSPSYTPNL